MIMATETEKRLQARELYQKLGSIKRTAKIMRENKRTVRAWVKDLIDKNPNNPFSPAVQAERTQRVKNGVSSGGQGVRATSGNSGSIHSKTRKNQRVKNTDKVYTSPKGAFELLKSDAWGWFLVPVADPRFRELSLQEINGIRLINNFPKIPAELWASWIDLCFHYCRQALTSDLEVSVFLCRNADPSHSQQWRMVIPNQTVSGVSVQTEVNDCIDLMTGERFDYFPPPGWQHAGSSHSHNTMKAFFSSTDDEYELSVPGIHIVVGEIDIRRGTYSYKSSIVLRQLRKHVDFDDIVEHITDDVPEEITFHPDVLKYIYKKSMFPTLKHQPAIKPKQRPPGSRPRFQHDEDDDDDYSCFTIPSPSKNKSSLKPIQIDPSKDFIDDELYLEDSKTILLPWELHPDNPENQ